MGGGERGGEGCACVQALCVCVPSRRERQQQLHRRGACSGGPRLPLTPRSPAPPPRAGARGPPHTGRAAQQHRRLHRLPGGLAGGQRMRAAAQPHGGRRHRGDQVRGPGVLVWCVVWCVVYGVCVVWWVWVWSGLWVVNSGVMRRGVASPFGVANPAPLSPPCSRSSVWQWLRYGVKLDDGQPLTVDRVCLAIQQELDALRQQVGVAGWRGGLVCSPWRPACVPSPCLCALALPSARRPLACRGSC